MLDELSAIWMLSKQPSATYEMELQWRLTHIWMFLWNHLSHQTSSSGNSESKHTDRLKNILMYIQEHYAEKSLWLILLQLQISVRVSVVAFSKTYE